MSYSQTLNSAKIAFILSYTAYLLAMFMPAATFKILNSTDTIYGYWAFIYAYNSIVEHYSFLGFFGSISNTIILFITGLLLYHAFEKTSFAPLNFYSKTTSYLFVLFGVGSVLSWAIFSDMGLLIGYFVWCISSIGIITSYTIYRYAHHQLHEEEKKNNFFALTKHIVEEG